MAFLQPSHSLLKPRINQVYEELMENFLTKDLLS